MDLTPFAGFLVASVVGLGVSALTFLFARKAGIAPVQADLVDTLEANTAALKDRVKALEEQVARETAERVRLQGEVVRLQAAIADLAAENAELRKRVAGAA